PPDGDWISLGVFALVRGEETTSTNIFQLAINKDGVLRGNYYDATTDTSTPVHGQVDKNSKRACWTVGDKKMPIFEAGIVNLTKDETTMMVHYRKDRSEQVTAFRIEQPEGGQEQPPAKDGAAPAKDGQ